MGRHNVFKFGDCQFIQLNHDIFDSGIRVFLFFLKNSFKKIGINVLLEFSEGSFVGFLLDKDVLLQDGHVIFVFFCYVIPYHVKHKLRVAWGKEHLFKNCHCGSTLQYNDKKYSRNYRRPYTTCLRNK
jgi:hypothetical protein